MQIVKYFFLIILNVMIVYPQVYNMNVNLADGTQRIYDLTEIEKIDFSGITIVEYGQEVSSIIKSFKLLKNYPNPFNSSTSIEYEIPRSGNVEIFICDLNGRLVKILFQKKLEQGRHQLTWDGLDKANQKVTSGLYIYSIRFDNTILSKKMILIK